MRIRIALSTAVAVIVSTAAFFMLLGSTPAESSARVSMHHQVHITHFLNGTQLAFFNVPTTSHSVPTTSNSTHVASPSVPKSAPVVAPAAPVRGSGTRGGADH